MSIPIRATVNTSPKVWLHNEESWEGGVVVAKNGDLIEVPYLDWSPKLAECEAAAKGPPAAMQYLLDKGWIVTLESCELAPCVRIDYRPTDTPRASADCTASFAKLLGRKAVFESLTL